MKNLRNKIKNYIESKPGRELDFGVVVGTVGTKYVHVQNLHRSSSFKKVPLEIFYQGKILGHTQENEEYNDIII